jgi:hypothetical protein
MTLKIFWTYETKKRTYNGVTTQTAEDFDKCVRSVAEYLGKIYGPGEMRVDRPIEVQSLQ